MNLKKLKSVKSRFISDKGSVLIYTLFIMIAVMIITITLIRTFIPKLKISSEAVSSVVALYAADSALEWCLLSNRTGGAPPPQPVMSISAEINYQIYEGTNITVCPSGAAPNYRAVGNYRGISRSLEIFE